MEKRIVQKKSGLYSLKNFTASDCIKEAAAFIKPLEGFVSKPFWDYKQWSWGYGTSAGTDRNKPPVGSISKEDAEAGLISHITGSYQMIKPRLQKPVSMGLMVALLSFDYNLGFANTKKIITRINEGLSLEEIAKAMRLYIYAGGSVDSGLIARRKKETSLFV